MSFIQSEIQLMNQKCIQLIFQFSFQHGIRYWSWSNILDWIVYSLSIVIVMMHAIGIEQDPEVYYKLKS